MSFEGMRISQIAALLVVIAFVGATVSGCGAGPTPIAAPVTEGQAVGFDLTSPAFNQGEAIPRQYTCDGEDVSPPLQWTYTPEGTRSMALISDDPYAPLGIQVP